VHVLFKLPKTYKAVCWFCFLITILHRYLFLRHQTPTRPLRTQSIMFFWRRRTCGWWLHTLLTLVRI